MADLILSGSTSGTVTVSSPAISGSSVLTLPASTDTLVGKATTDTLTNKTLTSPTISGTPVMSASVLTSATAQNSTSGTSIDFTGIPSWVKRITVMFNGVSTSGSSVPMVQIGSGSVEATGYASVGTGFGATTMATTDYTTGFGLEDSGSAAYAITGSIVLSLLGSNIWTASGTARRATQSGCAFGGNKTTSGTLDRVRITTVNGTDTFDAGSINLLYE